MTFFQWQADARRKTGRLVVLMVLAVLSLVLMTNVLVAGILVYQNPESRWLDYISGHSFLMCLAVIGPVVVLASLIKTLVLSRSGGRSVAESLGGHPVNPTTDNFYERRLLNVVEEMALAAGMPVPAVYILHGEMGINAFAAGYSFQDAVIGVTKGTMQLLTREELEGVIAHEFSHIAHGDMKLNMRLIGIIFGITMLAELGYFMLRSAGNSRSKESGPVLMGGLGLMVIGYSGAFFGNMIRASISRTREYLADASAVQYTRNRDGIAGALQKIGGVAYGSQLSSPRAQESSHMMFGQSVTGAMSAMFATHPALDKRIRKLNPSWDGQFISPKPVEADAVQENKEHKGQSGQQGQNGLAAAAGPLTSSLQAMGNPGVEHLLCASALLSALPVRLVSACRQVDKFPVVAMALILSEESDVLDTQLAIIKEKFDQEMVAAVLEVQEDLAKCGVNDQLPVLELILPRISETTLIMRTRLISALYALSRADGRTSPLEWSLVTVISHFSDRASERLSVRRTFHTLQPVRDDVELMISALLAMSGMKAAQRIACFQQVMSGLKFPEARLQSKMNYSGMRKALSRLSQLCPEAKEELLEACCFCVEFDGAVVPAEAQALRAMALVMDCPMPILTLDTNS